MPWKPEVGWFACDATVEGEEWPYCPRTILRHQIERARDAGFELKIGIELEYFLVRQTEDGGIEIADPLDTLEQPCYDIRALTRSFDFVSDVMRHVNSLGWEMYATDHEDANGQFEQNFDFADALTTCDRAVFYRYMVEALAQERGLIATFMPKPFAHLTGNGCHFHMSLWDGDTNLFDRDRGDDPRNLGLTDLAYHFVGGLKKHAKAYIALSAPTVSSYKRLVTGAPTSGATWAPAYVTYGWNNRTMMLRIPEAGRIEDRTVDGSCNPYLAATAILAAGMDGIENEIDPGDPTTANMYEMSEEERRERGIEVLPANLLDATRELEGDEVLRKALGSVGDEDYVDYFIRCKRREWQRRTSRSRSGSSTATCSTTEVRELRHVRDRRSVQQVERDRGGARRPPQRDALPARRSRARQRRRGAVSRPGAGRGLQGVAVLARAGATVARARR